MTIDKTLKNTDVDPFRNKISKPFIITSKQHFVVSLNPLLECAILNTV